MKKRTLTSLLLVTYFLSLFAAAGDWQLLKQSDGIKVYKRPLDGSGVEEFRAVAEVDSRIEVIGEVLRDVPSYPVWYAGCAETHVVERRDRNHFTFYFLQKTPWPVRNRDLVLEVATRMNLKEGWAEISLKSLPDATPARKGVVRARMRGSYRLEYLKRNLTRIIYTIWADPGGSLPPAMANRSMPERTLQTLRGIEKRALHPKYLQQAESSEDKQLIEQLLGQGLLEK
jgi:hypothetical protein